MTAAAAAMTSLVALVRFLETRAPRTDSVQLEAARTRGAATRDTLGGLLERHALEVSSEHAVPALPETVEPQAALELPALPTPCAAGTLELLVLENESPVPGAEVLVVARKEGGIDHGCTDDLAPLLRATTDSSGLAAWVELGADRYDTLVRHPNGAELSCSVEIEPRKGRERCVVSFGSARVHGTVIDHDGEPRRDSPVRLALAPYCGATELFASARTDEFGRFEFLHLPPSSALAIDGHPDVSWLTPGHAVRVELPEGAVREVALGPAAVGSRCEGRLVGPGGAALGAEVALRWREDEHDWHATTRASSDGSFDVNLRPGTWSAYVAGREGALVVARARIGADDVRVEAHLPPGCLSVRLVDASGAAVEGAIALSDAAGVRSEHPAPGGRAFVAGLAPGTWQVEGLAFDGAETLVQATVADHGAPLELTLELPPSSR
ncbi:MAG: hypothetical protein FJ294_03990 [Planctomycetes bacterium]|nr:hypothetical protein [Planctomycetota bacterium]